MAIALRVSNNLTPNQNHHYLNQWPPIMSEDIWHFNQCAGMGAPIRTGNDKAGKVYLQTEREYIARELEKASLRMALDLNYWLTPAYFSQTIPLGKGYPFYNQIFQTRFKKLIALGQRASVLISASVPVVYSDPYGVGVDELATITLNSVLPNDQIKLFFRVADGAKSAGHASYEIEPIEVTDNGAGVVTITGHTALFVKPSEWRQQYVGNDPNFNEPNLLNTIDPNNFVTDVDVYQVYTDSAVNAQVLSGTGTVLHTYVGEIVDNELGAFRLGYQCADYCLSERPSQVRVFYYAGSPLVDNNIDSELFEACCALACANMPNKQSDMSYWSLENWVRWHEPMVEKMGSSQIPVATKQQASAKYGSRLGQVLAWDTVMDRLIYQAHKFF